MVVGRNKILARASQVSKEGEESDYPAYGVTGPAKEVETRKIFLVMFWLFASLAILLSCTSHLSQASPAGDRKLAQSAQMYHYQVKRTQLMMMKMKNDNDGDDESNDDENADDGNNMYNYNVQHQKNQMIGLANGSSGGGGNASGGEESEPEVPDGTR